MKPFILALISLFTLAAQAQRNDVSSSIRTADEIRREQYRLVLERNKIVVHYDKDPRGEYIFFCDNKTFSTYTLTISFPEFMNLQANISFPAIVEVHPGTQRIFTLQRTGTPVRFRYDYHVAKGSLHPRPDTAFTYLLPIAPGKDTRVFELTFNAAKFQGESKPKDYYVVGIHMHSGDTVYAARRGRVTETSDNAGLTDSGYTYSREENYVEIEQEDGTLGKYIVFRDSAIFVHPGDWVEAGQPLGIVGGDRYAEGPHVRFSVRYHFEQPILDKDGQPTGRTENWAYVLVKFWVRSNGSIHLAKGTTYTCEHPGDLVTKEMTKKAARKWAEAHPALRP